MNRSSAMTVSNAARACSQALWARPSPHLRKANPVSTVMPQRPSEIPVHVSERSVSGSFALSLQRKLAVGSTRDPHEVEADAMAAQVTGGGPARARGTADGIEQVEAPPVVHDVLRARGSRSMQGRGR
jgi:hypothetical protein